MLDLCGGKSRADTEGFRVCSRGGLVYQIGMGVFWEGWKR